jgi:hypothetical protein
LTSGDGKGFTTETAEVRRGNGGAGGVQLFGMVHLGAEEPVLELMRRMRRLRKKSNSVLFE